MVFFLAKWMNSRVKTKMTFGQAIQSAKTQGRTRTQGSGGFLVHVIGFLCCVVMPAFWTAIAPVAMTTFTREEGKVRAVARTNLLFVIPYKTAVVENVTQVDDRFRQGEMVYSRRDGERHKHRAESESFLVIKGEGEPVEVPVSPVNTKSTVKKAQDFIADPSRAKLNLMTVANWKFSVIGGFFVTLLALLYTTGVILSIFRLLGRLMKSDGVVERHPDVLVK
jgi:hypothetical protein